MNKRWDFDATIESPPAFGFCVLPGWQVDMYLELYLVGIHVRISLLPEAVERIINQRFVSLRNRCMLWVRHSRRTKPVS